MKFGWKSSSRVVKNTAFDDLRALLEGNVVRPAVIVITCSTIADGKEIAARGLSHSLATTGYRTLFIDAEPVDLNNATTTQGSSLEDLVRALPPPTMETGYLAALRLSDPGLQRSTSQRGLESALEILRTNFDFVVISVEFGSSSSLATSVIAAADAVLVTVKKGRRENSSDARLSAALERVGSRFLGVVSLDACVFKAEDIPKLPEIVPQQRRSHATLADRDVQRREIVKLPT